jgi:hypothetical protein
MRWRLLELSLVASLRVDVTVTRHACSRRPRADKGDSNRDNLSLGFVGLQEGGGTFAHLPNALTPGLVTKKVEVSESDG